MHEASQYPWKASLTLSAQVPGGPQMSFLDTLSPSAGYSHRIEQQGSTHRHLLLILDQDHKREHLPQGKSWAGQGRGEQAHRVRSFLAGKAHPTKTASQCLTGSQQSHMIHHALGPRAACTALQGPQDRHRAPGAPYLPCSRLSPALPGV